MFVNVCNMKATQSSGVIHDLMFSFDKREQTDMAVLDFSKALIPYIMIVCLVSLHTMELTKTFSNGSPLF